MKEKRGTRRVPVALEVTHTDAGRAVTTQATNLGFHGMQLALGEGVVHLGEEVELEFELPELPARVCCDAEVVYSRGRLAGLRFIDLPPAMRRSLDEYVSARLAGYWFR